MGRGKNYKGPKYLIRNTNGSNWYIKIQKTESIFYRSTGTSDLEQAKDILVEFFHELLTKHAPEALKNVKQRYFKIISNLNIGYKVIVPQQSDINTQIYFIQSGDEGPIKIGIATDVKQRMKTIDITSPNSLRLLGIMDGDLADEKRLHKKFRCDKVRGEWFKPTERLMRFVQENARAG